MLTSMSFGDISKTVEDLLDINFDRVVSLNGASSLGKPFSFISKTTAAKKGGSFTLNTLKLSKLQILEGLEVPKVEINSLARVKAALEVSVGEAWLDSVSLEFSTGAFVNDPFTDEPLEDEGVVNFATKPVPGLLANIGFNESLHLPFDALFTSGAFAVGVSGKVDVPNTSVEDVKAGGTYTSSGAVAAVKAGLDLRNLGVSDVKASYLHNVDDSWTLVGLASKEFGEKAAGPSIAFGGKYAVSPSTSVVAKVDESAKFNFSILSVLKPGLDLTVSAEVDSKTYIFNRLGFGLAVSM